MCSEMGASSAAGAEILLVEDEDYLRHILCCCLKTASFNVLAVATGEEAVSAFQEHGETVRLVLTDLYLSGGMDGLETMAALRQLRPDLPFCVVTGDSAQEMDEELLASGPAHLFLKPFSMPELLDTVSRLLQPACALPLSLCPVC